MKDDPCIVVCFSSRSTEKAKQGWKKASPAQRNPYQDITNLNQIRMDLPLKNSSWALHTQYSYIGAEGAIMVQMGDNPSALEEASP